MRAPRVMMLVWRMATSFACTVARGVGRASDDTRSRTAKHPATGLVRTFYGCNGILQRPGSLAVLAIPGICPGAGAGHSPVPRAYAGRLASNRRAFSDP